MSCISRPKQPLGWGSPCHRLHMNSLRYSCYLLTIDQVLTNYWPIHQWSINEVSVKCRWSIGERKAISAETHLERLSTVPRLSVVRLSSESRPTIDRNTDRVSTDYRPLFRPIDRSTLPTVNRIRSVIHTVGTIQSNLTISNSVNLKSLLFRRKIKCPLIYPSPLRFPGYFEAPLFRTFFHFPWASK